MSVTCQPVCFYKANSCQKQYSRIAGSQILARRKSSRYIQINIIFPLTDQDQGPEQYASVEDR